MIVYRNDAVGLAVGHKKLGEMIGFDDHLPGTTRSKALAESNALMFVQNCLLYTSDAADEL